MFKLTNADSMIILSIILCELIIMMALLFHLQSKARKMEMVIPLILLATGLHILISSLKKAPLLRCLDKTSC